MHSRFWNNLPVLVNLRADVKQSPPHAVQTLCFPRRWRIPGWLLRGGGARLFRSPTAWVTRSTKSQRPGRSVEPLPAHRLMAGFPGPGNRSPQNQHGEKAPFWAADPRAGPGAERLPASHRRPAPRAPSSCGQRCCGRGVWSRVSVFTGRHVRCHRGSHYPPGSFLPTGGRYGQTEPLKGHVSDTREGSKCTSMLVPFDSTSGEAGGPRPRHAPRVRRWPRGLECGG